MSANESWVYQGRQSHGWFGHGTSPTTGEPDGQERGNPLFAADNAAQRVDYAAYGIVGHIPSRDRNRWNHSASQDVRERLKTSVAAWYGASQFSRDRFRNLLLDPDTSDEVTDALKETARDLVSARTYAALGDASATLAELASHMGPDRWPRFLADTEARARSAIAAGRVPGVILAATDMGTVGLGLGGAAIGGAIIGGVGGGGFTQPSSPPTLPAPQVPNIVEAAPVPVPPPREGETVTDVLKPEGKLVGSPGSNPAIRILPGGLQGAQEMFDRLTKGKNGTAITSPKHPGQIIRTTEGVFGIRPTSTSGPPTVDVTVKGLGVRELKFPGGAGE